MLSFGFGAIVFRFRGLIWNSLGSKTNDELGMYQIFRVSTTENPGEAGELV